MKYVVDRGHWSVGEICTCTLKVQGPGVQEVVGNLFRSTKEDAPIHIINSQEYSKRRSRPVAKAPRQQRVKPEVEMMEMDLVRFMKWKRGGDMKVLQLLRILGSWPRESGSGQRTLNMDEWRTSKTPRTSGPAGHHKIQLAAI